MTICPERELLPEYLTDRLTPADAARVHTHLAGCTVCRRLADELEVGLAAMAIARDEAIEQERVAAATANEPAPEARPVAQRPRRRARSIALVASACAVLVAGAAVGAVLERRSADPDTFAEVPLANASVIDPASGTATLAMVDGGLQIGLELVGLPRDADFFECLWHVDGETRSAGTFSAVDGAVDVDLVVAPFEGIPNWTLDIVAHATGEDPRVVLTAMH